MSEKGSQAVVGQGKLLGVGHLGISTMAPRQTQAGSLEATPAGVRPYVLGVQCVCSHCLAWSVHPSSLLLLLEQSARGRTGGCRWQLKRDASEKGEVWLWGWASVW